MEHEEDLLKTRSLSNLHQTGFQSRITDLLMIRHQHQLDVFGLSQDVPLGLQEEQTDTADVTSWRLNESSSLLFCFYSLMLRSHQTRLVQLIQVLRFGFEVKCADGPFSRNIFLYLFFSYPVNA